jgi:hypothetical protein
MVVIHECLSLRAGLIHLACWEAGLALMKELQCLRYEVVYEEVDEDTTGVHAIVAKLLGSYYGAFKEF